MTVILQENSEKWVYLTWNLVRVSFQDKLISSYFTIFLAGGWGGMGGERDRERERGTERHREREREREGERFVL